MNSITYFIRRKYEQIRRLIDYLPLIWNGYEFDYHYSIEIFKKSLERQAKFLESSKSYTVDAGHNASKIRTAIRLMDKVYSDEYTLEYMDKMEELYGRDVMELRFVEKEDDNRFFTMVANYEEWDNAEEVEVTLNKLMMESQRKQERAHKLLWEFVEHNIRRWWD